MKVRRVLSVLLLAAGMLLPGALCRPAPALPDSPAARAIRAALPAELDPLRRRVVEAGAALLGRVDYFWGGKSEAVGWDRRWGTATVVDAPGSSTTGQCLPFGLDCSGFVSWCAVTAAEDPAAGAVMGSGVSGQWAACTPVDWEQAQPGDLAFFPDLSHVGVVAGPPAEGALPVLHCSSSLGGVVCSPDAAAAGFTAIGRPEFYSFYKNAPETDKGID